MPLIRGWRERRPGPLSAVAGGAWRRLAVVAALLSALGVAGCSPAEQIVAPIPQAPDRSERTDVSTTGTAAARLRADLTFLLQEQVYLTALLAEAVLERRDPPAAREQLEASYTALTEAVAEVYGPERTAEFDALWRSQAELYGRFAQAVDRGSSQREEDVRDELETFREDVGAFLQRGNDRLDGPAAAVALGPPVAAVLDTIEAVEDRDETMFIRLRNAAQATPPIAEFLALSLVEEAAGRFDGTTDSGGADLRAELTSLLAEHVYLTAELVAAKRDDGPADDARNVLDRNSVELAEVFGGAYGVSATEEFLELWRGHVGLLVGYADGVLAGDAGVADANRAALTTFRQDFGAFVQSVNPNLPSDAVAQELVPYLQRIVGVIDAFVAEDSGRYAALRSAAQTMPNSAAALAQAIGAQFPERF